MQLLLNGGILDTDQLEGIVHLLVEADHVGLVKNVEGGLRLYVCKKVGSPQWSKPWWSDYAQPLVQSEEEAVALFQEFAQSA